MCGRYSLATPDPAALRARFALGESVELRRRYNIAPGDDIACVTTSREGEARGELLRWGLVPHWASSPATGYKMINARAETIAQRPAYRDALTSRRCLVVADGFYEWQPRPGRSKLPWWITRADGAPFAFAGLWAIWHGPGEKVLRSATIVTTTPNSVLADVHDRMPVILADARAELAWIDHATPTAALHALLAPAPDEAITRVAVGPAVSDARYDGPACLEPYVEDSQTLF